jgi:hypothetical protein
MSTFVEKVALNLLRSDGIKTIWKLHVAASQANQLGNREAAERLLQIADAAEEFCFRPAESWAGMMAAHSNSGFPSA